MKKLSELFKIYIFSNKKKCGDCEAFKALGNVAFKAAIFLLELMDFQKLKKSLKCPGAVMNFDRPKPSPGPRMFDLFVLFLV